METTPNPTPENRRAQPGACWPRRLAVALVGVTFPLLFVGGLVTTYDAGMAVPDWPNTYGYNLFLYPLSTWLAGPWNLFVEHGHRLLGAAAGLLMIALLVVIWRLDSRRAVRYTAAAALALVCGQGLLGGMRVLFDERSFARFHACVGPIFFSFTVALAVVTSRRWSMFRPSTMKAGPIETGRATLWRLSLAMTAAGYLQIVAGAFVRHFPVMGTPGGFQHAVIAHLTLAGVVTALAMWLLAAATSRRRVEPVMFRLAVRLACLVAAQLCLGAATWVLKYNWPEFMTGFSWTQDLLVERRAFVPALITTAHMATGSLVLVTALTSVLWSFRDGRLITARGTATMTARSTATMSARSTATMTARSTATIASSAAPLAGAPA